MFFGGFTGTSVYNIDESDIAKPFNDSVRLTSKDYRFGVNLGFRLMFGDHNSLELSSKIPIKSSEITQTNTNNMSYIKNIYKENYNILARYVFTF